MEERARLSLSASRSEALSTQSSSSAHHTNNHSALAGDPRVSPRDILRGNEEAMERPPRVLICHTCEHRWTSSFAADLRECPNCRSYSIFDELPRRTASPDNTPHHTTAPGEEALGQYFSERTDKHMNLYRQEQPVSKSTTDSHESLPNPWEHLHSSSNASLAKTSLTPQGGEPAQTEPSTTKLAPKDTPSLTAAQREGMQQVLEHICDYRDEDGYNPSNYFNRMVNKRIIPDYYDVIKEPMALSTIKEKIEIRAYQSICEFVRDFALIPFNAQVFNRPDSGAFHDALIIQRELEEQLRRLVDSGVMKEEDSILPYLGEIPDHHHTPEIRSYQPESSRNENRPTMDANMKSLREWQEKARRQQQSARNAIQQNVEMGSAEQPMTQNKPQETVGASAALVALQDSLAVYHQDMKPASEFDTENVTPQLETPDVAKLVPLSKICYTCRHRFTPSANVDEDECPKCGSDFIFADLPWNTKSDITVGDTTDKSQADSSLHPLGIAPPQLFGLIDDIVDAAARLQRIQDRHSENTKDVPEAVDQLLCLSDGFRRLAKLQNNPEYHLRFQRVEENVHVLCSSVRYTVTTALNALRPPLDETQWMSLSSSMRDTEQTDILERLRWYQAAILGLLDHLDGFTSESLLGMDTNIRSLLERQRAKRTPKLLSNPGTPPENVKTKGETDSIDLTDPSHIQSTQESLKQLTAFSFF